MYVYNQILTSTTTAIIILDQGMKLLHPYLLVFFQTFHYEGLYSVLMLFVDVSNWRTFLISLVGGEVLLYLCCGAGDRLL